MIADVEFVISTRSGISAGRSSAEARTYSNSDVIRKRVLQLAIVLFLGYALA